MKERADLANTSKESLKCTTSSVTVYLRISTEYVPNLKIKILSNLTPQINIKEIYEKLYVLLPLLI